jgi:hypothetical protein
MADKGDVAMAQHYSDESREGNPYALPDVETFHVVRGDDIWEGYGLDTEGYYYWYCFPGCLPDSEPIGPFDTEADALADARRNADTE